VEGGYQGVDVQVGGGKTFHLGAAPGLRLSDAELKQVRHHAVLGHGLAVQAIRARGPAGTKAGFAENIRVAVPVIDTPEHVRAAETATRGRYAGFMTVLLEGRYTDAYLAEAGGQTPRFTDDELATIASPLDFVGINVYKPGWYVEPSEEPPGYREIPINASHPKMKSGWHVLDPRSCTGRRADAVDLERPGQPGVERRLRQPLRADLRQLRHARAQTEARCRVVPRGSPPERGRLAFRWG
jgi:beta-glucosidase